MTTTEFAYPDLDTLTPELKDAVTSRASLNIFRMITHSPNLAPSFLTMAGDLLQHNSLPASWRELVVLRVGYRYHCRYETYQHERIGQAIGLSDDTIYAVKAGTTDRLDPQEATLMTLTDQLLDNHTLSDAERDQALTILSVNQLADFVLTVGFYQLVCDFLNTFGVTPEDQGQLS
jgi:4-carboxymuconolactone decarboxylase